MVSECANPSCGAPFLYLSKGKLFVVQRPSSGPLPERIEYFWLCSECATHMHLVFSGEADPEVVASPDSGQHSDTHSSEVLLTSPEF